MIVCGAILLILEKIYPAGEVGAAPHAAFWLCVISLVGIFFAGYVGYFVVDAIWPEFYYKPVPAGKNTWLLAQLACILCYFIGAILGWQSLRKMLRAIA